MMLLTKLKAAGAGALAVLVLSGGLGYGPGLVRAGDGPAAGEAPPGSHPGLAKNEEAAFLDRLSTELRGDKATPVEHGYFAADKDAGKRKKVVSWFLADDAVKAHQAKKLGAEDRVLVEVTNAALGLDNAVRVWDVTTGKETATGSFLLGEVVNSNAGVAGSFTPNERNFDLHAVTPGVAVVDVGDPVRGDVAVIEYPDATNATVTRGLNYLKRVQGRPPAALPNPPARNVQPPETGYFLYHYLDAVNPNAEWLPYFATDQPTADPNTAAITRLFRRQRLAADTDEAFLERAVRAARGTAPSEVEKRYFADDKDPQKRAKLLDLLLKDPAVAKKLGDDWKKRMLAPPTRDARFLNTFDLGERANLNTTARFAYSPDGRTLAWEARPQLTYRLRLTNPAAPEQADKFGKLVDELLAANRTDEQVLEAVTLAAAGRLPTDPEKRLVLATVPKAADKKAAWVEVAKALAPAK